MKRIILILFVALVGCTREVPTQFSSEALLDGVITLEGSQSTIAEILEEHKGKKILIDIWASWCGDCIRGLPKIKALQEAYKDVVYVFISVDDSSKDWKQGIKKYSIKGTHYLLPSGTDGDFGSFVNVSWIPRYMVIDKQGKIKLFKAVKANDQRIIEALKN